MVGILVSACSSPGFDVVTVGYNNDAQTLEVNPASCGASYESSIEERDDRVQITLTQTDPGAPETECLDAVLFELDEPLQDRLVVVNGTEQELSD